MLVLHGPNLSASIQEQILHTVEAALVQNNPSLKVLTAQANGEQGLLDALYAHVNDIESLVINPGILAPQVFALAEAVKLSRVRMVEVLLSAPDLARGPSALTSVALRQFHHDGLDGYRHAIRFLVSENESSQVASRPFKTIGRKPRGQQSPSAKSSPLAVPARVRRQDVKDALSQRLKGSLTADAAAVWARETWARIQSGSPVEPGAEEPIENALLTLMTGEKATDTILVSAMATLDR